VKLTDLIPGKGLQSILDRDGRFPPVELRIRPLQPPRPNLSSIGSAVSSAAASVGFAIGGANIPFDSFLSYSFSSNMLTPVDAFSFTFVAPDDPRPFRDVVQEGDVATLWANGEQLATGLIDDLQIETTPDGERVTVGGRDLAAQLEDQHAIGLAANPLLGNKVSLTAAARVLIENTRIQNVELSGTLDQQNLFATQPNETKISALQRLVEPCNCLFWMSPEGNLVIGKPNAGALPIGKILCSRERRESNVFSIRSHHRAATVPNIVALMHNEVQNTQVGIVAPRVFENASPSAQRLKKLGHRVLRTAYVSWPRDASASSLASLADNATLAALGGGDLLEGYAKRIFARGNFDEVQVEAVLPGHYNEDGKPFVPNTVYSVEYDRAGIDENMLLYAVDYAMTPERGQVTTLRFCKVGTIVADISIKDVIGGLL
jgi:prophage tail gpP-like protein